MVDLVTTTDDVRDAMRATTDRLERAWDDYQAVLRKGGAGADAEAALMAADHYLAEQLLIITDLAGTYGKAIVDLSARLAALERE